MAGGCAPPRRLRLFLSGASFLYAKGPINECVMPRLVGAFLFALHGCVDVSGHRLGTFLAGTLLLGLAQFCPGPAGPRSDGLQFSFGASDCSLRSCAVAWFFGLRNALPLPGYVGRGECQSRQLFWPIAAIASRKRWHSLTVVWNGRRSIGNSIFFARSRASAGEIPRSVRSRISGGRAFLNRMPHNCHSRKAKVWLGWQPTLAITAWREALQRRGATEAGLYVKMLAEAKERDATGL